MRSGAMVGCEALVRWLHPQRGLQLPGTFIRTAEETGLIRELGLWTLDAACAQLAAWKAAGLHPGRVAINVSALQFRDQRLPQVLVNVAGVDKDALETNSAVSEAVAAAQAGLDGTGRVLLRKSGTEPLVRVMVEAQDEASAKELGEADPVIRAGAGFTYAVAPVPSLILRQR